MNRPSFMVIAGETSGDMLAAELVRALRRLPCNGQEDASTLPQFEPRFFGAGGAHMAEAGVELALDLTAHSVIGLSDALKHYLQFRAIFRSLRKLAFDRLPDVVICVDFSGFNRRFAHAIREEVRRRRGHAFLNWQPKIIQYVSPQVWASRENRAFQMAEDYDLLLCTLPFEAEWYARKVPGFPVEFVGNPICDRHRDRAVVPKISVPSDPLLLLLPGSRRQELRRHLPVMLAAADKLKAAKAGLRARMVLPSERLLQQAKVAGPSAWIDLQIGGLAESLSEAHLAIASTGTVTLECAYFRVPTVALYKTSRITYEVGKRIVKVKHLAMPNLLAGESVFPEFVQDDATPDNLFRAALDLLTDEERREQIQQRLAHIIETLGGPGAGDRAAGAISRLLLRSEMC